MSLENFPSFLLNLSVSEMNGDEKHSYRFNSFSLIVGERQLFQNNARVPLTPKAFDVLTLLVERGGHLVEKDELMRSVWADSFVEEANVARIIHTLRKVLGEDHNGNKFIETVAKNGYRFVAKVEKTDGNTANDVGGGRIPETDVTGPSLIETRAADAPSTGIEHSDAVKGKDPGWPRLRTMLVMTIGLIVVVSLTGFWFFRNASIAKRENRSLKIETANGQAYWHYQQGRLLLGRHLNGDNQAALEYFERAIELDPNFAAAYAGKAELKTRTFWTSAEQKDISQARTAVYKALELDESNSYAHTILCRIKATYDWDIASAEKECQRAIELDPANPDAHLEWAFYLNSRGREDEALAEVDTTIALAPTSYNKRCRGQILYYSGRYDEALAELKHVEETDPEFKQARKWITRAYEVKKDYVHALESRIRDVELAGATPETVAEMRSAYESNGWPGFLTLMSQSYKSDVGYDAAATFAELGETDKAIECITKLYDRRSVLAVVIGREPRFGPLRNDPRFIDLVKRIGLN